MNIHGGQIGDRFECVMGREEDEKPPVFREVYQSGGLSQKYCFRRSKAKYTRLRKSHRLHTLGFKLIIKFFGLNLGC